MSFCQTADNHGSLDRRHANDPQLAAANLAVWLEAKRPITSISLDDGFPERNSQHSGLEEGPLKARDGCPQYRLPNEAFYPLCRPGTRLSGDLPRPVGWRCCVAAII